MLPNERYGKLLRRGEEDSISVRQRIFGDSPYRLVVIRASPSDTTIGQSTMKPTRNIATSTIIREAAGGGYDGDQRDGRLRKSGDLND